MQKVILIILATIVLKPAFGQLKNTRWEGAIKGDNPRNAILDFRKDTLILYAASNNAMIETMKFNLNRNAFTIKKINGQSDCDNIVPGKYGFEIKNGKILIKVINDACYDRSSALDITEWTRWKSPEK